MSSAPDFNLDDTQGGTRNLSSHQGRLVVLIFASQATQEASAKAASGLGKRLLQHPSVDMITAVGVPRMFKMMAMGVIKGAQKKALESAQKRFEKEGQSAPADLGKRIFILPDWDGAAAKLYGFDTKAKKVHLALIAPDGSLAATMSEEQGEVLAEKGAERALTILG